MDKYEFSFTPQEVEMILEGLSYLPLRSVWQLFDHVRRERQEQQEKMTAKTEAEPRTK